SPPLAHRAGGGNSGQDAGAVANRGQGSHIPSAENCFAREWLFCDRDTRRLRRRIAIPELKQASEVVYELGRQFRPDMQVPLRVFADAHLLAQLERDPSLEQLVNVGALPGITREALGMPDMHEGYGFPVGGVAGTLLPDGVISPGGIGFDINCGVRLLASSLRFPDVEAELPSLVHELSRNIPTGYGRHGRLSLSPDELDALLQEGVPYLIRAHGQGVADDAGRIEAEGRLGRARADCVSERAKLRGHEQLGTLGSGNHFLEIEVVDEIFDDRAAEVMGLAHD